MAAALRRRFPGTLLLFLGAFLLPRASAQEGYRFDAPIRLDVFARASDGRTRRLGRTPTPDGRGIAIPARVEWYVVPRELDPGSLEHLADLLRKRAIPGLLLTGGEVTRTVLATVAGAKHLETLYLIDCPSLGDDDLSVLAAMADLRVLYLGSYGRDAGITDRGVAHLARLESLETLHLFNCFRLTDAAVDCLAPLPRLRELAITNARLGDGACERLAGTRLITLNLYNCWDVTDRGASRLAAIGTLETLGLNNTGVGDDSLDALARLTRLRRLSIGGTRITTSGLGRLDRLPTLEWLNLELLPVTDETVATLLRLPRLRRLELQGCSRLTDAGLRRLARHRTLTIVDVTGCSGLTEEGIAAFRKARPDCRLIRE